jgi:acyl-CoA thioesterase FadM
VTPSEPGDPAAGAADLRHEVTYRARFDECGPGGVLRTSGILRWVQDCAWLHSEALGFTRHWYAVRGMWWLVRCVQLNVLGEITMGETITASTSIVGYRRVLARRRTDLTRAGGEQVAIALTDWVLTDSSGQPVRVPDEIAGRLAGHTATFTPNRVSLPAAPTGAARRDLTVRRADVDPMGHMNNAAYLDELDESLDAARLGTWTTRVPRRYRLEYAAAATEGQQLVAATWPSGDAACHRLRAADGAEVLRASVDGLTGHDAFREAILEARGRHAPGKDAGAG